MPVAFDAATENVATADPQNFTHTPSGTPRGVVVLIVHDETSNDQVSGVTYGGVVLTRVRTEVDITSPRPGRAYAYFRGSGIPTGAQTVSVNRTTATTTMQVVSVTLTAAGDLEVIDQDGVSGGPVTDPAVTLQYGGRTAIALSALYSGNVTPAAGTGETLLFTENLAGAGRWAGTSRQTTPGSANFEIGFTAAADRTAFVALAVSEVVAPSAVTVTPGTGAVTVTGHAPQVSGAAVPPTFVTAGPVLAVTGGGTVQWPVHVANDVGVLVVETANQAPVLSDPAGFLEVVGSPQGQGTAGAAGSVRLSVFVCRANSGSMTNPTLADAGDHVIARIYTFRGCVTSGDPYDVADGTNEAADTSASFPTLTTTTPGCLLLHILAHAVDGLVAQVSAWANANLTGVVGISEIPRDVGVGGGFALATGVKATPGSTGATTATLATSSRKAMVVLALKPEQPDPGGSGDPTVAHRYWRLRLVNTPGPGPAVNEVELVERVGTAGAPGSSLLNPAKMHPGVTHFRPVIFANWNNDADPTGVVDVDFMMLTIPAGYVPTRPGEEARRRIDTLFDRDGILLPTVRQHDGPLVRGTLRGRCRHGQAINFATLGRTFLTVPRVQFYGGVNHQPASLWGTAAEVDAGAGNTDAPDGAKPQYEDAAARDLDEGGFIASLRLQQLGAQTLRGLAFAGTNLSAPDQTDTIATLTNAPSNNHWYEVMVEGQAYLFPDRANFNPVTGPAPVNYTVRLTYVVETSFNSGATWQIRSSGVFVFQASGVVFDDGRETQAANARHPINVAGLTADGSDRIRIRLLSIEEEGEGRYDPSPANTFIRGSNGTSFGSAGVNFSTSTDQFASKTPGNGDFVEWEAVGYV